MNNPLLSHKFSPKNVALTLTGLTLLALAILAILYFFVYPPSKPHYGIDGGPVTLAPVSFILNVSSPDDNLLVTDPSLLLQGKTSSEAVVIASFNNSDQVIAVNAKGEFSSTVTLSLGVNNITITAFDTAGNSKTENRTVFYSKDKI